MDVDGEITSKSKKRRKIYNKMYQKPFIIFGLGRGRSQNNRYTAARQRGSPCSPQQINMYTAV
jgi:hypothetical protein